MAGQQDLRQVAGPRRWPSSLDVLRGPADRQRPPRHPPRRGPRLQGPVPPLQDHAGLPRRAEGRLGLPRPAGRARRREGARLLRQARHRGLRGGGVQRQVPRVGAAARRRLRGDDRADGLLGRHLRPLPHHGPGLRGVGLVGPQADPRQGPARRGLPRLPLLPPLRHRPLGPRARAGLRDGHGPQRLRAVPADVGPVRGEGSAARLDDDPVDPGVQHGRRRPARCRVRRGDRRHRAARRRRAVVRHRPRRGLDRRGPGDRPGHGALELPAALRARGVPAQRDRAAHRGHRRLRHDRGRHGTRAPVPRLRRGRHGGQQGVRAAGRRTGAGGRALRR